MDVEDDYSYTNAEKAKILRKVQTVNTGKISDSPEGIEDHGEEDKLAEEGNDQRGRRDNLGQQQEEHSQRQQDRDGQRDLG